MMYYCNHCGKTVSRNTEKAWIKSYCEKTGKDVRLMRLKSKFTCTNRNSCDWKYSAHGLNLCMSNEYCTFKIKNHEKPS